MSKILQVPKSTGELKQELTSLKLKIALQEIRERELDRLMQEYEQDEPLEKRLAQSEGPMLRRIDRDIRKMRARRCLRNTLPKVGKIAASLMLFFYLSLSVALAASPEMRVNLMNFFMNIEERYTSFGFEETGEFVEVPAEWDGYYYPTYIPEGFEVYSVDSLGVSLKRSDGAMLYFDEMGPGGSGNLDTENAVLNYIHINGHTALLVEKKPWTTILWNVDNRALSIGYTGDREEAIKIAESVRMIKE